MVTRRMQGKGHTLFMGYSYRKGFGISKKRLFLPMAILASPWILKLGRPVGQAVFADPTGPSILAYFQGLDDVLPGSPRVDHIMEVMHSSRRVGSAVFDHLLNEFISLGCPVLENPVISPQIPRWRRSPGPRSSSPPSARPPGNPYRIPSRPCSRRPFHMSCGR